MRSRWMSALLSGSLIVAALGATACNHVVTIDSDPPGALIRVNGEKLGNAPVYYNETTGWEKYYDLSAEKPGYKTARRSVRQTEWNMPLAVGSAIGGLICLVPFAGVAFARQLPDRLVLVLDSGVEGTPPPDTIDPNAGGGGVYNY